jgi:hypothetical protein
MSTVYLHTHLLIFLVSISARVPIFVVDSISKKKPDESSAMIGVGLFVDGDVYPLDRKRWKMTYEVLGFQYERLLTEGVVQSELPMFDETQEPGGGGRFGGENRMHCIYVAYIL